MEQEDERKYAATLYVIDQLVRDDQGWVMEAQLRQLHRHDTPGEGWCNHGYSFYGNDVVIDKVDTMDTTDTNLSLWDLTDKIRRRVWATRSQPSGDAIRKAIFGKKCPEEWCSDGFLSFHDQLQTLLYNNTRPIASTYEPLCPCCMGAEMVERYARERYLRATSHLNMDKLQEFLAKLRSRLAELGYIYSLRPFGEIDWATSDATEDEEEDSSDDSVWEQMGDDEDDEGPDFQPAPAAAIAALTCKPYVKSAKGRGDCAICQNDFNNGDAVVELPCGHVYCGSGSNCIVTWLKTSNSCPQCRARLLDAHT